MKLNLVFSLTLLSFAGSIGAIPILSSILAALAELPRGWEWRDSLIPASDGRIYVPDAFEQQTMVEPSKCIDSCLRSTYRAAGCQTPRHWDCLCRPEGLATEVKSCISQRCQDQETEGNLKVQDFRCRKMDSAYTNRDNEGAYLEQQAAERKKHRKAPV